MFFSFFWAKTESILKIRNSHFAKCLNLHILEFSIAITGHSRSIRTFAVLLLKIAKNDVTKTSCSKNKNLYDYFFLKFDGRSQIDVRYGSWSLPLIYATVFELSRKFGGEQNLPPPPALRVLRLSSMPIR